MAGGWEHEPGNNPQQSAECETDSGDGWMPIGERHCKRIQGEAQKTFAPFRLLGGKFDWIRGAGAMEMSSDGSGENDEPQTAEEEFASINGNGKGVELFTQHVTGGEWEERQAKQQEEVGIKYRGINTLQAVYEMIVINPVDPRVSEG